MEHDLISFSSRLYVFSQIRVRVLQCQPWLSIYVGGAKRIFIPSVPKSGSFCQWGPPHHNGLDASRPAWNRLIWNLHMAYRPVDTAYNTCSSACPLAESSNFAAAIWHLLQKTVVRAVNDTVPMLFSNALRFNLHTTRWVNTVSQ